MYFRLVTKRRQEVFTLQPIMRCQLGYKFQSFQQMIIYQFMKTKNTNQNIPGKLKRASENPYRQKLDSLTSGNILLPEPNSEMLKLRLIKPPIKNLRLPRKRNVQIRYLPQIWEQNEFQRNNFMNERSENERNELLASDHGKKNVELLDHMIDILRNKDNQKELERTQFRANTESDGYNEFTQLEIRGHKTIKGPILDPKISKFYDNKISRRKIYSEEKNRGIRLDRLVEMRNSVSKKEPMENFQLMTFYDNKNNAKDKKQQLLFGNQHFNMKSRNREEINQFI